MRSEKIRVLILGAGGMLGSAVFRHFSADARHTAIGTLRSSHKQRYFLPQEQENMITNIDVTKDEDLAAVFADVQPDVVINCVGIIKQLSASNNPLSALSINSILPHRLVQFCRLTNGRLVHISTDCVFSGRKGNYVETDFPDADDLYGRSKYLGEVDYPNAVTLRTSIIGHELESTQSLIDWFLSQVGPVKGYENAVFSGLPAFEIARIIRDFVIPNEQLTGVYHLSADPISKKDLLSLVAQTYDKKIDIVPDSEVRIDRSLNSERFRNVTGYNPESWPDLVSIMHDNRFVFGEKVRV